MRLERADPGRFPWVLPLGVAHPDQRTDQDGDDLHPMMIDRRPGLSIRPADRSGTRGRSHAERQHDGCRPDAQPVAGSGRTPARCPTPRPPLTLDMFRCAGPANHAGFPQRPSGRTWFHTLPEPFDRAVRCVAHDFERDRPIGAAGESKPSASVIRLAGDRSDQNVSRFCGKSNDRFKDCGFRKSS